MRTALLWAITQWVVVIPYRCFGTTYLSHLQGPWSWNYHYPLHNNPEELSSHSLHSRSLKSHICRSTSWTSVCCVSQHLSDFGSFISSSVGDSTWHCIGWYFSQHIVPLVKIVFLRHLKYIAGFKGVARVRRVVRLPWVAEFQGQKNEYCKWKILIFSPPKK